MYNRGVLCNKSSTNSIRRQAFNAKLASDQELTDKYGVEVIDVSSDNVAFEEEKVNVYCLGSVS